MIRINTRIQMADVDLIGEPRASRVHFAIGSYREPKLPPEVCPKCLTPLHVEGDNLYCQDRHHSWAIPIPTEPFDWTDANKRDRGEYGKGDCRPHKGYRVFKCEYCGKRNEGRFYAFQKYCSKKCCDHGWYVKRRAKNGNG